VVAAEQPKEASMSSSPNLVEINEPGPFLAITDRLGIKKLRQLLEEGGVVIWNREGAKARVPHAVLENCLRVTEARLAQASRSGGPRYAQPISWDQAELTSDE
jgi:hypothetical protein